VTMIPTPTYSDFGSISRVRRRDKFVELILFNISKVRIYRNER